MELSEATTLSYQNATSRGFAFDKWILDKVLPLFFGRRFLLISPIDLTDGTRWRAADALFLALSLTPRGFERASGSRPAKVSLDWLQRVYWHLKGSAPSISTIGRLAAIARYREDKLGTHAFMDRLLYVEVNFGVQG